MERFKNKLSLFVDVMLSSNTIKNIQYDDVYRILLILLAFVMPLSRAAISFFVVFIIITYIIEGKYSIKWKKIYNMKPLRFIIYFVVFMNVTLLWSKNIDYKTFLSIDYNYLLLIPVFYTILKREWTYTILNSFLMGMFVSEVISYGIYFGLWSFGHGSPSDPTPFMNHIAYSIFLAFTSVLLLSRLFSSYYNKIEKFLIFPFFITVTINLFITGGRTGQIAFIFGVLVMFIIHYRLTIKSLLYSILLLVSIYFVAYNTSQTFQKNVDKSFIEFEKISHLDLRSSFGVRVSYILITKEILEQDYKNILFGVGYNDVHSVIQNILDNKLKTFKLRKEFILTHNTHNQYLQLILQSGVVGLILFFSSIFFILKSQYYIKEMKDISILFLIVFLFSFVADTILELQFSRTLFILIMSLIIVNIKIPTQKIV